MGFYEISNVFVKSDKEGAQPDEPVRLAVMVSRPEKSYEVVKGILDALARELNLKVRVEQSDQGAFARGRAADVELDGVRVGVIGQIHPEQVRRLKVEGEASYFEVDLSPLIDASRPRQFMGSARFPSTSRDLTVLVPEAVTWQSVYDVLAGRCEVAFVGDYYGAELPEGVKSMTVRLTLAHPERTPTEVEAAELESAARRLLERKLGAQPRE